MENNEKLDIAVGPNARAKKWTNTKMTWGELSEKLMKEHRTKETLQKYLASTKEEQTKIKDVGGYVGGYIRGGKRNPENIVHRQILTLDLDFARLDFWDEFKEKYKNVAAVLHATHKHHAEMPRYRLVMPFSREVTADEYVAASRKIAGELDIELFDNTTFETNRLMFWPSSPKDVEYYAKKQDGKWIDVDEVLNSYEDWRDANSWPVSETHTKYIGNNVKKQEDPTKKSGVIGAFCRTYSIEEAIETHLSDVYEKNEDGRYTYKMGSTSSGMVIYDNNFSYSHHGTDPSEGKLCNSFDLVRIHKFGMHDNGNNRSTFKTESFELMKEFAWKDKKVTLMVDKERLESSKFDFAVGIEEEEDREWILDLEKDKKGNIISSSTNIDLILRSDPRLKERFKLNTFDTNVYVFGDLPWREVPEIEPVKNVDLAGLRNYLEGVYGVVGVGKIEDSHEVEIERNKFNPVKDYLSNLLWDGTKRVDTLLVDFFGVEDSLYTREAMRKTLVGAVSRIMRPGCKFDLVLTIIGKQGSGKSTFIKKLGRQWFSDTFYTMDGKDAFEQIQGFWIVELAELAGLRKAQVEATKHFISKQEDDYRPPYQPKMQNFKRQCIFIATTNTKEFLTDPTGNRRFLPVESNESEATRNVFKEMTEEFVDQIWAETVEMYEAGETSYLSREAEKLARVKQANHSETDERKGIFLDFLDTKITEDWDKLDIYDRRSHLTDPLSSKGKIVRETVCIAELWTECLGKNLEDMESNKSRPLSNLMRGMEGWKPAKTSKRFPIYGMQRYYVRTDG